MNVNKALRYEHTCPDFDQDSSQQFATVLFDRVQKQDGMASIVCTITVVKGGEVYTIDALSNRYNPSCDRNSSCVYVKEECENKTIKICTIQHKGTASIEVHRVSHEELCDIFLWRAIN